MEQTLLARQPIYNRQLEVVAYELLFRADERAEDSQVDIEQGIPGDNATEVMLNIFSALKIPRIAGKHLAFINFTRNLLIKNAYRQLPKAQAVIEILENIHFDQRCLNAIKAMVDDGYQIALDDFIYKPELEPLMAIAHFIKIDVVDQSRADMIAAINLIKTKAKQAILIAEKVENQQTFQACLDLGFDYFQGYYFSRPKLISHERLEFAEQLIIFLLKKLQHDTEDPAQLQSFTENYDKLAKQMYLLLNHYVNTKNSKLPPYDIIAKDISYPILWEWVIGASLYVLDTKPYGLMKIALTRARMCEQLAKQENIKNARKHFLIGLLSTLHRFFDQNYIDFVTKLELETVLHDALLYDKGDIGNILYHVKFYEKVIFDDFDPDDTDLKIKHAYLESIAWFNDLYILFR